ncbi:MAG: 30S ribosomal protein S3 [Candidatus Nealsonbacteria bacterium]|nr:30S ribosomal protein S3 [Candidatus Nealsonbacteria bacterium]
MSHKVQPKSFRLRDVGDWESRWFNWKKLRDYLEEDFIIRKFLEKKLKESGVQNIEIERFADKVTIIINSARPGFIIGRGGKGAEDLKKELDKKLPLLKSGKREMKIEIREVRNPWISASLAGQWMAQQIEKRVSHRRVIKQSLEKIMANKEVKGARIEMAGRLGGNEIARREWLKKGRMPRQTIRAIIDYAHTEALCTYGIIGIKVWIYKGDKFD